MTNIFAFVSSGVFLCTLGCSPVPEVHSSNVRPGPIQLKAFVRKVVLVDGAAVCRDVRPDAKCRLYRVFLETDAVNKPIKDCEFFALYFADSNGHVYSRWPLVFVNRRSETWNLTFTEDTLPFVDSNRSMCTYWLDRAW